ncbi:hypothetical protein GCM10023333_20520 [Ferrimonas pelagia]|uniref:Uncharacterized protein n=1 Tax=Ferrimonas pelagia TaxID=1177826 RepID=A0ABP9EV47_9GAMM
MGVVGGRVGVVGAHLSTMWAQGSIKDEARLVGDQVKDESLFGVMMSIAL